MPKTLKNRRYCHIVIIGANFAGLTAAINLPRNYSVDVIDYQTHFEFLPNIHELLSGVKTPENLQIDRRRLLERAGHRFVIDRVTSIDFLKKRIYTSGRKRINYDICVLAIGGINNTFGISGAAKFGMPFKSIEHCRNIGQRLESLSRRRHGAKVVIVGGGLEGVEALGEILRRYRRKPSFEIHLIESKKRLLGNGPKELDQHLRKLSEGYDVHFHTGTRVTKISGNKVWLSSRLTLGADATLWTGGAVSPPLLYESGLSKNPGDWAAVNMNLQSTNDDSIFIAGDAAQFPGLKRKQAYDAMDMGKCVAQNIKALLTGEDLVEFLPSRKPTVVSFGDLQTYVIMGNVAIGSPVLATIKEGIYQTTMARLDPPTRITPVINCVSRTRDSFFNLAIPALTSFSSLRRLTHFPFFGYKESL